MVAVAGEGGGERGLALGRTVDQEDTLQPSAVEPPEECDQAGLVGMGRQAVHHLDLAGAPVLLAEDAHHRAGRSTSLLPSV